MKRLTTLLPLSLLAVAGCTTTGVGTGYAPNNAVSAHFAWTSNDGTTGTMTATLAGGAVYQGQFFQITHESTVTSLGPLWDGWYGRRGWHGWGYWGPDEETITHYTGKVLANLVGPDGRMRCRFDLIHPSSGMSGGGQGECQLPGGAMIDADFPVHR